MRTPRLRSIIVLGLTAALIGCSSGDTGKKPGGPKDAMQRSSRVLRKKKPAVAPSSAPAKAQTAPAN